MPWSPLHHLMNARLRWARFAVVGVTAAGVHMLVAAWAVEGFDLPPQAANLAGFGVAFLVSYVGQRRLTFDSLAAHRVAMIRFAAVAVAGTLLNLMITGLMLRWQMHYLLSITLGVGAAAVLTYQLNRHWTFGIDRSCSGVIRRP